MRNKEHHKAYLEANKERINALRRIRRANKSTDEKELIAAKKKAYNEANKERNSESNKKWREANKESNKERKAKYNAANREKLMSQHNEYHKKRKSIDEIYKLKCNLRSQITTSFTKKSFIKESSTEEILGCTFEQFKEYLEGLFEPWMSWENRGLYKKNTYNYGWDIDHKIPLDSAITVEDVVKLNHYTNLQPLCSKVNRDEKKAKF